MIGLPELIVIGVLIAGIAGVVILIKYVFGKKRSK